jgi:hypothetical protein
MTQRERTNVTVVKRRLTAPRSSLAWRLFALVFAVVAGLLAMALSVMLSTAQAQASPQYTFTKWRIAPRMASIPSASNARR